MARRRLQVGRSGRRRTRIGGRCVSMFSIIASEYQDEKYLKRKEISCSDNCFELHTAPVMKTCMNISVTIWPKTVAGATLHSRSNCEFGLGLSRAYGSQEPKLDGPEVSR